MKLFAASLCAFAGLVLLPSTAAADSVIQLDLMVKDLVYDDLTQRIYASVPSGPETGNSIIVIDPSTGTIEGSTFVGSEPGKMDISDDGQFIYVALDGAAAIRRYEVDTQTAELQFSLGADPSLGPLFVEDLKVLPGNPHAVAVARRNQCCSPRHMGVAIYDDGVQRPIATPGHTGSNVITISDLPGRLYGLNNETSEFGFRRMAVDPTGVTVIGVTTGIAGYGADIRYDAGRVYSTSGRVINPEEGTLLGTFAGIGGRPLVAPDSSVGRVFFVSGDGPTRQLRSYDPDTFLLVATMEISGVSGDPASLIRWGADGLAFRTTSGQVFLIQTSLVPPVGESEHDMRSSVR